MQYRVYRKLLVIACIFFANILFTGCQNFQDKENIYIAVASSMIKVAYSAKPIFEKQNPQCQVQLSVASSGSLYSGIKNGAPYHAFMGADTTWPQRIKKDLKLPFKAQNFAKGRLIFWSQIGPQINLKEKIIIADYKNAPYGRVAYNWLISQKSWNLDKIITASSASKIPFIVNEGGFKQAIIPKGLYDQMPKPDYTKELPIQLQHQMIQIKEGACIDHWIDFITTDPSFTAILHHNGFEK